MELEVAGELVGQTVVAGRAADGREETDDPGAHAMNH
jgi:hypothetical protein